MKTAFAVIDADNNISWSEKKEAGETFTTFAAAKKRAEELADYEPGKAVGIYEKVGEALATVSPVKTTRRK